jgi:hypothetical protein
MKKKKKKIKRKKKKKKKKKVRLYSVRSPSFGHFVPRECVLHLKVNFYVTEFTVPNGFS